VTALIHILTASHVAGKDLATIARAAERTFAAPVQVEAIRLDLDKAFDASRSQYSSGILLAEILSQISSTTNEKYIVVVDVDLYIPVLTFIFGEAQFRGPAAIVSTHRLSNLFYGIPNDKGKLVIRLAKEVVHELGHTFGLYHCHQFECVMRSSTYVEEIDLKRVEMCAQCASLIHEACQTGMEKA